MRVVVADTSPLNYLVLLGCVDILRQLYGRVVVPAAVFSELTAEGSPAVVAAWISSRPEWIEVREEGHGEASELAEILAEVDAGEAAAIRIAVGEAGGLLLIDDAAGRAVASRLGMANTGTLGVLVAAGREGWIDLGVMLGRLGETNFRVSRLLLDRLLAENTGER
jgi:predicted nucleic acid-binding protein